MKRLVALAVCGALAVPAMAFAADPAPAATATVAATPAAVQASVKDKKICKTMEEKGSRLGGKRVCHTKAEWDDLSALQRQDLSQKLTQGPARAAN